MCVTIINVIFHVLKACESYVSVSIKNTIKILQVSVLTYTIRSQCLHPIFLKLWFSLLFYIVCWLKLWGSFCTDLAALVLDFYLAPYLTVKRHYL